MKRHWKWLLGVGLSLSFCCVGTCGLGLAAKVPLRADSGVSTPQPPRAEEKPVPPLLPLVQKMAASWPRTFAEKPCAGPMPDFTVPAMTLQHLLRLAGGLEKPPPGDLPTGMGALNGAQFSSVTEPLTQFEGLPASEWPLRYLLVPERVRDLAEHLRVLVFVPEVATPLGLLHLPEALVTRMGTPPRNWLTFTEADWAGLDFGWLRELAAFDHWSLTGDGPVKNQDQTVAFEEPMPSFMMLMQWQKLRLMKGLRDGDLAQATVETRHLGRLIESTGTLLGLMILASMNGVELLVWQQAGLPVPPGAWSDDERGRVRRLGLSSPFFLYPGVSEAVRAKALACAANRCSMLAEGIDGAAALREVTPQAGEDLQWLLGQHPCDEALARRQVAAQPLPLEKLKDLTESPGVRQVVPPDGGS
jgi:hypothetical protein